MANRDQSGDLRTHVTSLQNQLVEIQKVLQVQGENEKRNQREKQGESLNEDFEDDNPYSRLMAAQTLGVVENYEMIRGKSVAVVGCGGVGVMVCEMLARCGVGVLSLYDREKVNMCHLSRMFFRPDHLGWSKTQVCRHYLTDVNPDVHFRTFDYDITHRYEDFVISLRRANVDESSPVDLVIACTDNRFAALAINEACLELNVPWICASSHDHGLEAIVTYYSPGRNGCMQCPGDRDKDKDRAFEVVDPEGVHVALPSTDAIVAGLATNVALKALLKFGKVDSVSVDTKDHSMGCPARALNPDCANELCRKRQQGLTWGQDQPDDSQQ